MSICEKDIIKKPYNEALVLENLRRDYGLTIINNVNSNLIVCSEIFNGPLYTTNLTKLITGLTESSYGVFNLSNTDLTINFNFTGNTDTLSGYTGTFNYGLYQRIQSSLIGETGFTTNVIFSEQTTFSGITSSGFTYSSHPNNLPQTDQEYILNSYTEFLTKECNIGTKIINPSLGNVYDEDSSWYFVTLVNPETPILGPFPEPLPQSPEILTVVRKERIEQGDETYVFGVPQATEPSNECRLITENLTINSPSSTLFSISNVPSPNSLLVSVNGITLGTDDYSISANTIIQLTQPLDPNKDIITATYIDCDEDLTTIYSEQYEIVSGVTSGATSAVTTTDKVYYNTDQNKYEYYLDFEPDGDPENIIIFINGVKLTYGLDYVISSSVNNRIIFIGVTLGISDIIYAVYLSDGSLQGDYGLIETQGSTLEWRVNTPIVVNNVIDGEFLVEVTENNDPNFTSTATTKQVVVGYTGGETNFSTSIPEGLDENKQYIWRVINKKVYSGLLGNIFTTESISRVGKFYTKILPY